MMYSVMNNHVCDPANTYTVVIVLVVLVIILNQFCTINTVKFTLRTSNRYNTCYIMEERLEAMHSYYISGEHLKRQ